MTATKQRPDVDEIVRRPYTVEVVYGETAEDGVLARIAEWPGCMTAAETRVEAVAQLEDAMRDWVEAAATQGLEIPEPLAEYGGSVLVRMPRTFHRDAARRAAAEGVSMNQWISAQIARALGAEAGATSRRPGMMRRRAEGKIAKRTR